MRFLLDDEQRALAETADRMLAAAGTPSAVRSWAAGDPEAGRRIWRELAGLGLFQLAVSEKHGGAGFLPVELAVTLMAAGRHAAPGPYAETVAFAVLLDRIGELDRVDRVEQVDELGERWSAAIARGDVVASFGGTPSQSPYVLDGDLADVVAVVEGDVLRLASVSGGPVRSFDPARRLLRVGPGEVLAGGRAVAAAAEYAADVAAFAISAQATGVARMLLDATVEHAKRRSQFGRAIGEFQAVKHRLADVLLACETARLLVHGAAVGLASEAADRGRQDAADRGRQVAAAKVASSEAAYAAARAALQIHGAIGYTDEFDLSLWIRKAMALQSAWGPVSYYRARILGEAAS